MEIGSRARWTAMALAVSALWACGGEPGGEAEEGDPAGRLDDLAARYWEWSLEASPVQATYLGVHRYGDRLRDIGPEAREARLSSLRSFRAELAGIDRASLDGQDRLTWSALEETLERQVSAPVCADHAWVVDPRNGPQVAFQTLADVQPAQTPEDGRLMVRRWDAMGPHLDDHVENLRRGLAEGRPPARILVEHTLAQLDTLLSRPDSAWTLAEPAHRPLDGWPEGERAAFRNRLLAAIATSVRPAFERYRDFLRDEALAAARGGESVGVHALPDGEACYRHRIRAFTSLELTPRRIHDFGLAENARIREEMVELGTRVFGTSGLAAIQRRLREDPAMHFDSAEEILATAEEATARAVAAIPRWFGRLPEAEIVVEPIPPHEAPYTTIAYYRRPAADGSRPGTYFVNTHAPTTRTRYEAEVLAFHEGVPGHHLQIAIAQELEGLPEFRKHGGTTAFVEGWALYTERLAGEMGLYSGDLDRLGVLSFDAWRASRLVVDTGIHAFGWTRREAIDYMLEHTLLAANNVRNEVDRYIGWPGQALAYKLGQREILELREEAQERMGDRFSIRDFHDRVLENGAVSLATLREVVESWAADGETPAEEAGAS